MFNPVEETFEGLTQFPGETIRLEARATGPRDTWVEVGRTVSLNNQLEVGGVALYPWTMVVRFNDVIDRPETYRFEFRAFAGTRELKYFQQGGVRCVLSEATSKGLLDAYEDCDLNARRLRLDRELPPAAPLSLKTVLTQQFQDNYYLKWQDQPRYDEVIDRWRVTRYDPNAPDTGRLVIEFEPSDLVGSNQNLATIPHERASNEWCFFVQSVADFQGESYLSGPSSAVCRDRHIPSSN